MRGAPAVACVALLLFATAAHSMSPLLGGKSERAVDDHATQLAAFAVGEIAAKANAPELSLVRVTKLSTQVVAGIKYYFTLEAKDKAGATRHYEAQVWEKPGGADNSAPELTGYKELTEQAPAGSAGAWADAAAAAAVSQINMRSNSLIPYELVAISEATPAAGGAPAQMVLQLRRGDKAEAMRVHLEPRDTGRYGLVSFTPL